MQFKSISTTESAKEARDILQIEFEKENVVRKSRTKLLISKFENLRIEENESIGQYHAMISDISNESFIMGEKIPKEKLI